MSSPSESFYSAVSDHEMAEAEAKAEADTPRTHARRFRPVKRINNVIQNNCHIYLDEQLYHPVLTLLGDLVTAGAFHTDFLEREAIAPLPFHIELVSSLLVHPRWTTQLSPNERADIPAKSITLLRNILAALGPVNANLGEAFSLTQIDNGRPSRRGRYTDDDGASSDEDALKRVKGLIANAGRLRRSAKDFWHILGWAFNCSVKHRKRWHYWKVWLDYMLDVLDQDYQEREKLDKEDQGLDPEDPEVEFVPVLLKECLLIQYLSEAKNGTAVRRIMRSVFADGGPESLKEFPEVYKDELKERKPENDRKRKRGESSIKAAFGDYNDDVADEDLQCFDEGMSNEDNSRVRVVDPFLGGTESIALRQRILALLSRASAYLEDNFIETRILYEATYTCMKALPIPAFTLFLAPVGTSFLPTVMKVSLTQYLLRRLLPNNAPAPQKITKRSRDDLDQNILEQCFLPFPASTSTVSDNAKVSIMVEFLFRMVLKECTCIYTPLLKQATEDGIKAREDMINKRRKSTGARREEEKGDIALMKASGNRMRTMLSLIERQPGI